jgi:hypothetical protein
MTVLFGTKSKSIPTTKDLVREASDKVKVNQGWAGVDEIQAPIH